MLLVEKAAYLAGLFKALGLSLDISSFEKRKKIQKLVYLLKLKKDLARYLPFEFNIYFAGPYSTELADVYYSIDREGVEPAKVVVDEDALEYAKYIGGLSHNELELIATLVELIRRFKTRDVNGLAWLVKGIKPKFTKKDIETALKTIEYLEKRFGVDIEGV